jgi:hypothetical protein
MDIAIHKTRHHYRRAGVNFFRAPRQSEILQPTAGANFGDHAIRDQYRAVLNNSQVSQIGPAPGTAGPAQRKQLSRAPHQRNFPHFGEMPPF